MRIVCATIIGLLCVGQLSASSSNGDVVNPYARVRAMQKTGERLLADGLAGSSTFRRLVHQLEQSDVIVYIELRPDLPRHVGGTLRFMTLTETDRYLHIRLNRAYTRPTLISLLGHELQHAVEIAESPSVKSREDLRDFYRRVGVRTSIDTYDSMAAQRAGYAVRAELYESKGLDLRRARSRATADQVLAYNIPLEDGADGGGVKGDADSAGREPIGRQR